MDLPHGQDLPQWEAFRISLEMMGSGRRVKRKWDRTRKHEEGPDRALFMYPGLQGNHLQGRFWKLELDGTRKAFFLFNPHSISPSQGLFRLWRRDVPSRSVLFILWGDPQDIMEEGAGRRAITWGTWLHANCRVFQVVASWRELAHVNAG